MVAGGNPAAERHFEDTIQRKRTLEEVRRFLPSQEIENLERIYHGSNFIVWGAVPGQMNDALFIVASEERRRRVFEELSRPTFSGPRLRLNEVIRFLGYKKVREIDESLKNAKDFDTTVLLAAGERIL